jgi:iron complex transport system ATP-binding protein
MLEEYGRTGVVGTPLISQHRRDPARRPAVRERSPEPVASEAMDAVLELTDVVFRRSGSTILDGVSLRVLPGEHWALLGRNGAGKSTVLAFCGALQHPTSGTVDVLGGRLGRVELQALRRRIGHVNPRHPIASPLSVREVVLTGITGSVELPNHWTPAPDDVARADELVERMGLAARIDAVWPTLSQGERGRALIARALIADPSLLLLDEPSTGLDLAAREQLLETVDSLEHSHPDLASVLVTHHLEELPETTTHAMLIAHGRVVAAGPAADVITSETVSRAFEHPIEVGFDGARWSARALRAAAPAGASALGSQGQP